MGESGLLAAADGRVGLTGRGLTGESGLLPARLMGESAYGPSG
jgi:hypothetical protein